MNTFWPMCLSLGVPCIGERSHETAPPACPKIAHCWRCSDGCNSWVPAGARQSNIPDTLEGQEPVLYYCGIVPSPNPQRTHDLHCIAFWGSVTVNLAELSELGKRSCYQKYIGRLQDLQAPWRVSMTPRGMSYGYFNLSTCQADQRVTECW